MAMAILMAHGALAVGAEREDLETLRATTLNLIKLLVEQGVLTQAKADELLRAAAAGTAAEPASGKASEAKPEDGKVVRVPYVPEFVRQEIREQLKQDVLAQARAERWGEPGALPEWLGRFTFEGDVRFRYQLDKFEPDNTPPLDYSLITGTPINNTQEDRDRLRLRARLGVKAKVSEAIEAGLRLTTGSLTDPLSTNQTLGNAGNKLTAGFDLAYVKASPAPWFSASAGRIANPWLSTDLVWNENLGFDGAAASFMPRLAERTLAFVTLGAFPLEEREPSPNSAVKSKWIYGAQTGIDWGSAGGTKLRLGLAGYDFKRIEGVPNPAFGVTLYNGSAPQFRQKGNTLFNIDNDGDPTTNLYALASKFRLVNLTAQLALPVWDGVDLVLTGDYVRNVGFDRAEIARRTGFDLEPRIQGYHARVALGASKLERSGQWQAFLGYKYIERDAVPDAFNDADFRLGGTDSRGYYLGAQYALARNTTLGMRWLSANAIDGPPLSIDVLQLDLNVRF
jgi:hypothetical protein